MRAVAGSIATRVERRPDHLVLVHASPDRASANSLPERHSRMHPLTHVVPARSNSTHQVGSP